MDVVVAIGTLALAAATSFLAFFTWRSVKLSERAMRASFLPIVVPRGEFGTSAVSAPPPRFQIDIRNVGRGPAFDVKVEATFQNYSLVAGPEILGPGETDTLSLDVVRDDRQYPQTKPEDFDANVIITWRDAIDRPFKTRAAWAEYERQDAPRHHWYDVQVTGPDLSQG